jgi:hypothetical protein
MEEWKRNCYWNMMTTKTVFASYGGKCTKYIADEQQQIVLSHKNEEADTLITFHAANTTGDIIVRATDTDVLIILLGYLGRMRPEMRSMINIIMDCGMGNNRRYININHIAEKLEVKAPGLAAAMPGYHCFTGCDYTSSFYRYINFLHL